jgi:hypothetical protein
MKYLLPMLLLLVATSLWGQSNNTSRPPNTKDKIYERRNDAESKTGPFTLKHLNNNEARHIALVLKIDGDRLVPVRAVRRRGILPYRPTNGGQFQVELLDANGKRLNTFSIQDPTIQRSCDGDDENDVIRPLPNGTEFEIVLPDLPQIARVQMVSSVKDAKYSIDDVDKLLRQQR